MKYFFAFLGVMIAIVMGMIIVLRFFVNPSAYQDYLTQAVQNLSGEKIAYQSARLTGYFHPVFQFAGVSIGADSPDKTTIEKMDISVSLLSLLNKKMDCSSVHLRGTRLILPADKKTLTDFILADIYKILTSTNMRQCFGQIAFDDMILVVGDKNAQISGSLRLKGKEAFIRLKGVYQDLAGTVDMRATLGINQEMTFDLSVQEDKTQMVLKATGRVKENKITALDGYVKVADTVALLHNALPQMPPFLTQEAVGNFSWVSEKAEQGLKDFTLTFGKVNPVSMTGQYLQKADNDQMTLFFNRLDKPNTMALSALLDKMIGIRNNRPLAFDVGAESLSYDRATIKNLSLQGQIKGRQITLRAGQVQFDNTDKITFTGTAQDMWQPAQKIALSGQVDVPEIATLLGALLPQSEVFQLSNFHHFAATLDYKADNNQQEVDITDGLLDKTQVTGKIAWDKNDEWTLDLNINQLDATLLLKKPADLLPAENPLSLQGVFGFLAKPFWMQGPKLHFHFTGDNIQMGADNIVSGQLQGDKLDDRLNLTHLELNNFYKSTLKISGIATGCGSDKPQIQNGVLELKAPYFTALQQQLNLTLPPVLQEKQADVMLSLSGTAEQLDTHLKFDATDFVLESKGTVLSDTPWHVQDNTVQITYPNFHQLLRKLGYETEALARLDGRLVAQMTLTHGPNQLSVRDLNATIGVQSLTGRFDYTSGDNSQFAGDFQTKFFDIEKIWPLDDKTESPLNWALLYPARGAVSLKAEQLRYNGGVIKQSTLNFNRGSDDIKASLQTAGKEGTVDIHITDLTTGQAHIDFDFQNFPLKTRLFADKTYALGGGNITAKGQMDCQAQSYDKCFETMRGQADFSGTHLILSGVNLMRPYTLMRQDVLSHFSEKAFMDALNTFGQDETDVQTYQGKLVLTPGRFTVDKVAFTLTKMEGSGKVNYQLNPPLWTAALEMSFPEFKTLETVKLQNKYHDMEHHWAWDAQTFYQRLRQNNTGQEVAEKQENTNARYLWQQQDLAAQGLWQDIISWQDMPVNAPLKDEIADLKARWGQFATTLNNLSDNDFQRQKAALQSALESLHQKMQAHFENIDLQGSIFVTEPILID